MGKAMLIIGVIIFLLGIFYVGAPHDMHVATGLGFNLDHSTHQMLGAVLIVVGAVIEWKGRKQVRFLIFSIFKY